MIGYKLFRRSLLLIVFALGAVAFAGESDANLCYTDWAGQCQTQRQWEAGWCYANLDNATCDAHYPDITLQPNGQSVYNGNSSSVYAAGQSAGNENSAARQSISNSQSGLGSKPPAQATPTDFPCAPGYDCSSYPPIKLPATPTPPPGQHPPSSPSDCPPGYFCED